MVWGAKVRAGRGFWRCDWVGWWYAVTDCDRNEEGGVGNASVEGRGVGLGLEEYYPFGEGSSFSSPLVNGKVR